MSLPRVAILTCSYRRAEIFRLFLRSLHRALSPYLDRAQFHLFVGGDEADDGGQNRQILESARLSQTWVAFPNRPLGRKWQTVLAKARSVGFDYALILGSDDLICHRLVAAYLELMACGYDDVAVRDLYFLDAESLRLIYYPGYRDGHPYKTIGAGRLLSRRVIDALDGNLWNPDLDRALDRSLHENLRDVERKEILLSCRESGFTVLDIKSPQNLWTFRRYAKDRRSEGMPGLPFVTERFGLDAATELVSLKKKLRRQYARRAMAPVAGAIRTAKEKLHPLSFRLYLQRLRRIATLVIGDKKKGAVSIPRPRSN